VRASRCEGGAKRVAQRPERSAGQHEILEQKLPGQHDSTGNPPADAAVAPGVVNSGQDLSGLRHPLTPDRSRGPGHAEARAGAQTKLDGNVAAIEMTMTGNGLDLYPDCIPVTTEPGPGNS
jgi:hypothetical protein